MTIPIIQARTSSKRLPNKVMKIINGKRLISFVYDRVKVSKKLAKFISKKLSENPNYLGKLI